MLGNGDVGYTVPAEIEPDLYHKKGALACARTGDNVNPSKASSGCQFYIAQGKVYTDAELNQMEDRQNMGLKQQIFTTIIDKPENAQSKQKFIKYQHQSNIDSLRALAATLEPKLIPFMPNAQICLHTRAKKNIYHHWWCTSSGRTIYCFRRSNTRLEYCGFHCCC